MFKKYQHIERLGSIETDGIDIGNCYIFPKIDGTNASVWIDNGIIKAGSRNRELSLDRDNAGFYKWVLSQDRFREFFGGYPNLRLYGEWLVPHSLKTYRDDAWRDFYVFDVMDGDSYIPYDEYTGALEIHDINYIPYLATCKNPSEESIDRIISNNTYLISENNGVGEGVVLKNYDYVNKFGKKIWAKVVTNEFKDRHRKVMGGLDIVNKSLPEERIVDKYLTESFINKEYEKVKNKYDGFSSKNISELLQTIYYTLIKEESWNFIKELKNPKIDFKRLNNLVVSKTKDTLVNVF